jgi:hypothetical protein
LGGGGGRVVVLGVSTAACFVRKEDAMNMVIRFEKSEKVE